MKEFTPTPDNLVSESIRLGERHRNYLNIGSEVKLMSNTEEITRVPEAELGAFGRRLFVALGVHPDISAPAIRSLLDASLMGIDSHGIESLDMYAAHLRAGGPEPAMAAQKVKEHGGLSLWDMANGLGLYNGRRLMEYAVTAAGIHGIGMVTCRRTNHIGACSVYGKMAADAGMIGLVSAQSRAMFAPWGGKDKRIGQSPLAVVVPVEGRFPFCYDGSFASMTNAKLKDYIRRGETLPNGVATDEKGRPTTDPQTAWTGQIMPIGRYKGVGLAMAFEILHCVLAGNIFALDVPSVVSTPEKAGDTSLFMMAIAPDSIMDDRDFSSEMKRYVDYVESSEPTDPAEPPWCPGKKEGDCWEDRRRNGIPLTPEGRARLIDLADQAGIEGFPIS